MLKLSSDVGMMCQRREGAVFPPSLIGMLCLIAALTVLFCCVSGSAEGAETKRHDVPLGDGPFLGPASAPLTIIEFLDFQ